MEKYWLFYYEGCHPGEWESNAQKLELSNDMRVTDSMEQTHKTLWFTGLGSGWELMSQEWGEDNKQLSGLEDSSEVLSSVPLSSFMET